MTHEESLEVFDKFSADDVEASSEDSPKAVLGRK
jgi:hypothetical protein